MFLKNKNIIFKIRRSKVTDYAALTRYYTDFYLFFFNLAAILEIRKLDSEDAIFSLSTLVFGFSIPKYP